MGQIVSLELLITLFAMGFPRSKHFVFDRKAGTVRYPGFLDWRYKQAFSQVNFIYARAGMYVFQRKGLAILHGNGVTHVFINFQYPERFLLFYVWYMDRNRPLPWGTAFNPCRGGQPSILTVNAIRTAARQQVLLLPCIRLR